MKGKIFSKKTIALFATVGLAAGLLTPLTSNITFAQDNGINIGTRTSGDVEEELSDILDYKDYAGDDHHFISDVKKAMSEYDYLTLYNIPEEYSLDLTNEVEEWSHLSLEIHVGGAAEEAKYKIEVSYNNTNKIHLAFPALEDFLSTYDENVENLVDAGTKYVVLNMPEEIANDEAEIDAYVNLTMLGLGDVVFAHTYYDGWWTIAEFYPTYFVYVDNYNTENYITFYTDHACDDSGEIEETISINTWDAQEDDYLEEVRNTIRNYPHINIFSYPAGPEQNNIPADFFEVFKEENKGISFDMTFTEGLPYSLIFNQIDTAMNFNPQAKVSETEINGAKAFVFDFEHNGALPGTMTVRAFVGVENNAPTAYLYYVNEDGTLEKMESGAKLELGYAEFTIDHCSSYVVSAEDLTGSTAPENPGDSGNEEEQPPVQTPDDNTDVDLTDKDPADTGASTAASALMSMIVLSGAFAGIAGIMRHKAKN